MELNLKSSPLENEDSKATFRKPMNDVGNRKYRRRSSVDGSSSSEGSPIRDHNSSPTPMRKDPEKGTDDRKRKDEGRDLDRDSGKSQYGRRGDLYRHSDRHSSRSSRAYHRHDDYHRRDKYADDDDDDRDYSRSSRSGRDSRSNTYSDRFRRENEYRSRDHPRDGDKYCRDKSDGLGDRNRDKDTESLSIDYLKHKEKDSLSDRAGSGRRHTSYTNEDVKSGERDGHKRDKVGRDDKIDHQRSSRDHKGDCSPAYEDSRSHRNESTSRRDGSGRHLKEASRSDNKSMNDEKYTKEEKKNHEDKDSYKEHGELEERYEDTKGYSLKDQESSAKKAKLSSLGESLSDGKDVMKSKAVADEKQSLNLKQAQQPSAKGNSEQALTDSDIDAAKIAAMKAAELVNQNLVGTGFMSTDQKKKLLWGNKKNTAVEESGHRWDTAMFGDRERQEKFNKLMSLRLHWCLWPIVGCEGGHESRTQTRPARRGEAKGAPIRFREAIHCGTSSKRWSHCWFRSLRSYWMFSVSVFSCTVVLAKGLMTLHCLYLPFECIIMMTDLFTGVQIYIRSCSGSGIHSTSGASFGQRDG